MEAGSELWSAAEEPGRVRRAPLAERVGIVTGGGGGIGAATVRALVLAGAAVLVADFDGSAAGELAAALREEGHRVSSAQVDVTDPQQVAEMVAVAHAELGSPSILVNSAGVADAAPVASMDIAAWRRVLDVNLTGPLICCKAVLPAMIDAGRGKIINIASIAAKRISFNGSAAYTASKAGLVAFTRHLAFEVAHAGINVNAICPGPTDTAMLRRAGHGSVPPGRAKAVPRGRLATPADHADAVVFLASDAADMVCGVALDIDGGALLGWEDIDSYLIRRHAGGRANA